MWQVADSYNISNSVVTLEIIWYVWLDCFLLRLWLRRSIPDTLDEVGANWTRRLARRASVVAAVYIIVDNESELFIAIW